MEVEPSPQSIDEALDWHSAITDSVIAHRAVVLNPQPTALAFRFVGLTIAEINAFFEQEQSEVDGMCLVNMVAAAEAALRADFRDRVRRNRSDDLSKAYVSYHRTLSGPKVFRPDFDKGGILDAMKLAHVIDDHLITDFRHVLRVRHWYAHGRYWLLKSSANDEPVNVHAVIAALLNSLGIG